MQCPWPPFMEPSRVEHSVSLDNKWRWTVCVFGLLSVLTAVRASEISKCDFRGSGLEQDPEGVQPVYLTCSAGRVMWLYPRAALRVVLQSPLSQQEFHGCIKLDPAFDGARIFIEGHRSLIPLYSKEDSKPKGQIRCFSSYKSQVALYVEAEDLFIGLDKKVAAFDYDLHVLPKGTYYTPEEECRPCTEKELLHYYCSSDFVASGTILGVRDDQRLERSVITFQASKVHHQNGEIFRRRRDLSENHRGSDVGNEETYIGTVVMPVHCGASAGPGEFLILGSMRLGEVLLRCATRQSEWRTLVRNSSDRAQCLINL